MMLEPAMIAILKMETCCGKPCKVVETGMCNPYQEIGGIAVCLVCGNFTQLTGGQLDGDELANYKVD
jgi:hypothetical protein